MKINTQSKKPLKIALLVGVILIIILGASALYFYKFNGKIFGWSPVAASNSTVDYNPPTQEQIDAGNQIKEENTKQDESKPNENNNTPSDQPANTPAQQNTVGMNITAANQNGSMLQIRTLINIVSSSGTCTLNLTKSGSPTVTKTANVQALPSSSTCQGFDVPVAELSSGTWTATVQYTNGATKGSATQNIVVKA